MTIFALSHLNTDKNKLDLILVPFWRTKYKLNNNDFRKLQKAKN